MSRPAARATKTAPPPAKPRVVRPAPVPATAHQSVEVAVPVDRMQRRMVDEYGELDRRMQLTAPDRDRYDTLKRAIKSWFDGVPPDADGVIEGAVYRLHLSARERERRVKSLRDLAAAIGIEKFFEIASVPIGAIEDLLGKTRAAALVTEARTGSRRIKAVPMQSAGKG